MPDNCQCDSTRHPHICAHTDTGKQLVNTDKSVSLYQRDYAAGTVTLGGNDGPGNSMYVVVIVPRY